jgi:hypothetical protein
VVDQRREAVNSATGSLGTMAKALICLSLLGAMFIASPWSADASTTPEIKRFFAEPSTTQAGGHPDLDFALEWTADPIFGCSENCVIPRRTDLHFPEGFIGNPHVAPKCRAAAFAASSCSADSQIGYFKATFVDFFPVYNLETSEEQAGLVGYNIPIFNVPVYSTLSGRTGSDYGLDSTGAPFLRFPLTLTEGQLWGVPADPIHNPLRFKTPMTGGGMCSSLSGCTSSGFLTSETFATPTIPPAPFLQNPTTCEGQLSSVAAVEYYAGVKVHATAPWPKMTGCQQLSFNPSQTTKPTTTLADSPSGVDSDLKVPQTQSPFTASPSQIRANRVTLPEGFSINPSAADGKVVCRDSETSIGTLFAARCPEFAKVGTTEIDTSALPAPILGGLYLGEPKPGNPYRLILTADGFATHVKLAASVRPDPQTGRLVTAFENLPQTPIQRVNVHFFGSERGLLATSERCGVFTVGNEFVPWDSELTTRLATSFITIDGGPNGRPCPEGARPFHPRSEAGTANNTAGRHAPFSLILRRDDGDQNLAGVSVATPPGFAATLKGVRYCPEAAIARLYQPDYYGQTELASSSCPTASQVGTAVAGAGAGSHPLYVGGKTYLAGPYKGAPLSLVVVVPAVSGPYDLGVVAVRAAIEVDPRTARVKTISDPLPQILGGIPLRTRFIRVDLDRPGFALNPTNCDPLAVETVAAGDEGATAEQRDHFQVSNCAELRYGPRLSLTLTGGVRRRGHPAIHAVFRAAPGEANTRRVSVLLPKGGLLDNDNIGGVCSRVQFSSGNCPGSSVYGSAEATTPLLDEPLKGPVYLRSSTNDLPDLVADLKGQVDFVLVGRVDSVNGRLRNTFEGVPDVPVSKFSLDLLGGRKGLLQNGVTLCGRPKKATVKMTGQNGAALRTKTRLRPICGTKKAERKGHGQVKKAD